MKLSYVKLGFFLLSLGGLFWILSFCTPTFVPFGGSYSLLSQNDDDDDDDEDDDEDDDGDDDDDEDDDEDDDGDDDDDEDDEGNENSSPYETVIDTISFLTCRGTNTDETSDFTLKLAAYNDGGIRIKKSLRDKSESKIKSDYSFYKSKLGASWFLDVNRLSRESRFIDAERLRSLSRYLNGLLEEGSNYVNEIEDEPIQIKFHRSSPPWNSYRGIIQYLSKYPIFVGYLSSDTGTLAHFLNSAGRVSNYDGVHYEMSMRSRGDGHILDGVREINELQDKDSEGWDCPSNLRYIVYFKEGISRDGEDDDCEDSGSGSDYNLIKNILGDQWKVNVSKKCVSPRRNQINCYLSGYEKIETDLDDCSNHRRRACPHYLSVCVRDS